MAPAIVSVAESAVELTHALRDHPHFLAWWDRHNDSFEGRAGFSISLVDLARRVSERASHDWLTYDWYLTLDAIAEMLIDKDERSLSDEEVTKCLVAKIVA